MNRFLHILFALLTIQSTYSQSDLAIAYYDVGALYDTTPSRFYDDSKETPSTEAQYRESIADIVSVIDSISMPLIILRGVESETVVRDLVAASTHDYSYLHRTLDYYDGLDFALLYFGDIFFIESVINSRGYLYVAGEWEGQSIDLHMTLRGDKLRNITPLKADHKADIVVACGNLSSQDLRRLSLSDPLQEHERQGRGDRRNDRGWYFRNRVGVDTTTKVLYSGLYITDQLAGREQPHLPIYLYLQKK